jgi:hypothetical protein
LANFASLRFKSLLQQRHSKKHHRRNRRRRNKPIGNLWHSNLVLWQLVALVAVIVAVVAAI